MNADAAQMNVPRTQCSSLAIAWTWPRRTITAWFTFICAFLSAFICVPGSAQTADAADDPFAYLENRNDPRTEPFFRSQAALAAERLSTLPGRAEMLARMLSLTENSTTVSRLK